MSSVISVENLGKRYIIGHQRDGRDGLRHALEEAFRNPFKWILDRNRKRKATREEFWALQDLSFQIQAGETIGVIGRNGAGKSTLLKILSRITEPTTGRIHIRGRVASLLEVGTGFHQELTGRENIFLNGAILGMSQREIRRKFDEIVAFSEVERFLDTPVKRYSSGMYVRLAFAVAAHLDPEILIVDEVLAVGDAAFQRKCFGTMSRVAKSGRTVLFVSHNVNAIAQLCSSSLVLRDGKMVFKGPVEEALSYYLPSPPVTGTLDLTKDRPAAYLRSLTVLEKGRLTCGILRPDNEVTLVFEVASPEPLSRPQVTAALTSPKGERVFAVGSSLGPTPLPAIAGNARIEISFRMPALAPARYSLDIGLYDSHSGLAEEYYSAGTIEVPDLNYLQSTEAHIPQHGHLLVPSVTSLNTTAYGSICA